MKTSIPEIAIPYL